MVDVVVGRVVGSNELQWVPWEVVSTVIVDGLDGGHGEKPHSLAVGHLRQKETHASSGGVQ